MDANPPTPPHPERKNIRYKGFDYRRAGAYFVTICATKGRCIFGKIIDGTMMVSPLGEVAYMCWSELPTHFSYVALESYVIMPNHIHGLLWLQPLPFVSGDENTSEQSPIDASVYTGAVFGARTSAPTSLDNPTLHGKEDYEERRFSTNFAGSLSTIVSSYKAAVTRQARRNGFWDNTALWQARFWDRIVRDDIELNNIRHYIADNPNRWAIDQLHPDAPSNRFNQWGDND